MPSSSAFESPGTIQPVVLRLALIGNTGDPESQESVLNTLLTWTQASPVIIFLGDTIYDEGMPLRNDPDRLEAERHLNCQLAIIQQIRANAIFIPGNHDWAKGHADGRERLRQMHTFIQQALGGAGCFEG
jgi:hypothetical protein